VGKTDMVSKSTYERMKEEYAEKLAKSSDKLKALNTASDGAAVDGIRSVAVGATCAVLDRWRVKLPMEIPLLGDSIAPAMLVFQAGYPIIRSGLSKPVRKFMDQAWNFGLAKIGYNGTSSALDSMMKS